MCETIVITGASSAIGRAVFQEIFQEGDRYLLHGNRNSGELEPLRQHACNEENIQICQADFLDPVSFEGFLEQIGETDILINAAAVTQTGVLPHLEAEAVSRMLRVNIEAFTRICGAVIPGMAARRRGCIVNISSAAASRGNRGQTVYAGTKGYMEAFTRSLAAEYGAKGIRVNCVAPGPIDSGSLKELLGYAEDEVKKSVVANRLGTPQDVAHAVGFLCSEKAAFINGKVLAVDGGLMRGI